MEIKKFEYLENEKSFLDEIKSIFQSFWRAIIWWEIKIWLKLEGKSFNNKDTRTTSMASLLLTLNIFRTLFWYFYCWLWTSKCRLGGSSWLFIPLWYFTSYAINLWCQCSLSFQSFPMFFIKCCKMLERIENRTLARNLLKACYAQYLFVFLATKFQTWFSGKWSFLAVNFI